MNVFKRELKSHRKAIIIWSLAMILFVIAGMQKYTSMINLDESKEAFLKMVDSMPGFLKSLWGISSLDITSAIGYFGVLFSYLLLMGGIHASMLGVGIIYKEERDKTVEFLMTKPISREKIITAKICAGIVNIVILNLVTIITSIVVLYSLTNKIFINEMVLSMISMFFIQLLFMLIGSGIAAIRCHPKESGSITMAILIFTYILSIVVDTTDKLKIFKFLTPFKYFESKDFFVSHNLNYMYISLVFIIITVILIFTYKKYRNRDLNL